MPDHATEAAELLANDRADVATAHALLAIHEQLAAIARRLPNYDQDADQWVPLVPFVPSPGYNPGRITCTTAGPQTFGTYVEAGGSIRTQVANLHRPTPDCGKSFVECIQTLEANRIDPSDSGRYASGWNGAMDAIRDSLLAHGYTASDKQEGGQ